MATDALRRGRVLAADPISREGVVLLATDHVLTAGTIIRIRLYEQREGIRIELRARPPRRTS
jgi:hypothetical protein